MNLYTSGSRYFFLFFIMFATYLGVSLWSQSYIVHHHLLTDNDLLLSIQRDKIKHSENVEIAFVGDSSLGNSIDARLVEKMTGKRTINAALTGSFGVQGSLNMARGIYQNNRKSLRTIVLMQSLWSPTVDVDWVAYYDTKCLLCSKGATSLIHDMSSQRSFSNYLGEFVNSYFNRNYVAARVDVIRNGAPKSKIVWDSTLDYFTQGVPMNLGVENMTPRSGTDVKAENMFFLHRFEQFCIEAQLTCLYAHGPLYSGYLSRLGLFVADVNKTISEHFSRGISAEPYPLSNNDAGDSWDHTRPASKRLTTAYYVEKLRL
jgi:hypothetical protein